MKITVGTYQLDLFYNNNKCEMTIINIKSFADAMSQMNSFGKSVELRGFKISKV